MLGTGIKSYSSKVQVIVPIVRSHYQLVSMHRDENVTDYAVTSIRRCELDGTTRDTLTANTRSCPILRSQDQQGSRATKRVQ